MQRPVEIVAPAEDAPVGLQPTIVVSAGGDGGEPALRHVQRTGVLAVVVLVVAPAMSRTVVADSAGVGLSGGQAGQGDVRGAGLFDGALVALGPAELLTMVAADSNGGQILSAAARVVAVAHNRTVRWMTEAQHRMPELMRDSCQVAGIHAVTAFCVVAVLSYSIRYSTGVAVVGPTLGGQIR